LFYLSHLAGDFDNGTKLKLIKKALHKNQDSQSNGHSDEILSLALSDDGKFLASASRDRTIKIWNPKTCEFIFSFEGHRDAVSGLAFRSNSHQLFSCSFDRTVKVWNVDQLAYVETL
jgi:ribosomal RNA-processing protein 9